MSWVKIDDHFPDHPKMLSLEDHYDAGMALHIRGLCYCAANLTDGFIPMRVFKGDSETASKLVAVGLWENAHGGWRIHDYLFYNPSREESDDLASARSDAGRVGAEARWNGKSHSKSHSKSDGKNMPRSRTRIPTPIRNPEERKPLMEDVSKLAGLLVSLVKGRDPKARIGETSCERHILEILKAGRSADEIERVIRWSQADSFWRKTIVNSSKLIQHFDTLYAKTQSEEMTPDGVSIRSLEQYDG